MSSRKVFLLLFCSFLPFYLLSQATLIEKGSVWKYYDAGNDPANQDALSWNDVNYNDNDWKTGAAQLGYGDNDEATTVNAAIRALYLRKTIEVSNPSLYETAVIDLLFDDGAVVYLNGEEVSRVNMPEGEVSYNTFASSVGAENGEARIQVRDLIQQGINVLAIEVHQESSTSSDISFDLSLKPFDADLEFTSSPLPLLFINTENNGVIQDEPKINAQMRIVYNEDGSDNQVNSTDYHFDGRVGIELRGQSSLALFPKKGYGLETRDEMGEDLNVSLLGFPEESDWVIHSPYSDKTLMRNVLTYHLGGQIMAYAPRVKLCELILNDEYLGVVVFTEKIKRDKNRVDVNRLREDELTGDDVTGGYILRFDKSTPDEVAWVSQHRPIPGRSNTTEFIHHYPKAENIANEQHTYIRNWVTEFENVLKSNSFDDPNNGYRKYIDVNSFVDMIIMNEVTRNVDGYRLSTYMYKQKDSDGGKFFMGPIWDYNLAFGNANYCDGGETWGWAHQFNRVCPQDTWVNAFWWDRLLSDDSFRQQLKDRYFFFRESVLSNDNFMNTIDSITQHLGPTINRNFEKWPVLGQYVWPNKFIGRDYDDEITELKRWINARLNWLDSNISSLTTNVLELNSSSDFHLYPNPATDKLFFEGEDLSVFKRIRLFSIDGRLIEDLPFNRKIDLKSLNIKGMHILHLVHEDGSLFVDKIVIE